MLAGFLVIAYSCTHPDNCAIRVDVSKLDQSSPWAGPSASASGDSRSARGTSRTTTVPRGSFSSNRSRPPDWVTAQSTSQRPSPLACLSWVISRSSRGVPVPRRECRARRRRSTAERTRSPVGHRARRRPWMSTGRCVRSRFREPDRLPPRRRRRRERNTDRGAIGRRRRRGTPARSGRARSRRRPKRRSARPPTRCARGSVRPHGSSASSTSSSARSWIVSAY